MTLARLIGNRKPVKIARGGIAPALDSEYINTPWLVYE